MPKSWERVGGINIKINMNNLGENIKQLLSITNELRENYKKHERNDKGYKRNFTLDGKLVGDIGEILAEEIYEIELYPEYTKLYDAFETGETNRKIQIKSSMKGYYSFPYKDIPEVYLALFINDNGTIDEIYNGPGKNIFDEYIEKNGLTAYKKIWYTLNKNKLIELNKKIKPELKIKRR